MLVTAPASSANLGPGFDSLGLALDLPFRLRIGEPIDGADLLAVEDTHPAGVAFRAAGGRPGSPLYWRSPIPPGRGMGFSGAARVAGAYLGARQSGVGIEPSRARAFEIASGLERHPDNAAASTHGGFVVTAGDRVIALPMPSGLAVVMWWPAAATSTDSSRRSLADAVSLSDASFSVGRAALWVAAIAAPDLDALRVACEDRLHQDARLAGRPDSAAALEAALSEPSVLAAWLSGSGPSVATLVPEASAGSVAAMLSGPVEAGHQTRVLDIAATGVTETA